MSDIPSPITRKDQYLSYLTGNTDYYPIDPITREEKYLFYLCENGGISGGSVTPEQIQQAVAAYLEENPVQPGATVEQVAQIEKNKTDISELSEEIEAEFDLGEWIPDTYINSTSGTLVSRASGEGKYYSSDFISCVDGTYMKYRIVTPNDPSGIAFYDKDKLFLKGYSRLDFPEVENGDTVILQVPDGARYFRTTKTVGADFEPLVKYINIWGSLSSAIKESDNNTSEIEDIKTDIQGIIPVGFDFSKWKISELRTGYIDSGGNFVDTSETTYGKNWRTIIFEIVPNVDYRLFVHTCVANANHAFLDENKVCIRPLIYIENGTDFRDEGVSVTSPENARFFALQYSDGSPYRFSNEENAQLSPLPDRVSVLEGSMEVLENRVNELSGDSIDYSPIQIPYIFKMINNGLYSREYIPRVFPESFLDFKPQSPITVNHRRDTALDRQGKTTTLFETVNKNVVLRGEGYKEKTVQVKLHCLNENVFDGKDIRLCLFGVSFDSINYRSVDGSEEDGGTMTINLLEKYYAMGKKDNNHSGNFVSVGTLYNPGDMMYDEESIHIYGCHEARGGNNGINYLRQPMNFSPTNIDYDPNVSGTSATGEIMWYMCGLRYRQPYNIEYSTTGTDYGEYERTKEKTDALRHTPFGKYHHDYSESLWEFCNKKGWITLPTIGGTYSQWTGSEEQKGIVDKCMEYVQENPDYPFYDVATARETSYTDGVPKDINDNTQYSLNYNKMLERYRTMDDLGVRLVSESPNPAGESVMGSDGQQYTIGTKITTQDRLSKTNMCKPTHVLWDMAFNDWVFYVDDEGQSGATDSIVLTELFISAIRKQLGDDLIIGLKAKKANGSFFPDIWGDIALSQEYKPTGNLINYNKLLIDKYSDLSQKISYIPIFAVSIPYASNFLQEQEDFVYGKCLINSGDTFSSTSDVTHEGLASAKAMTYQIYGWMAYTVK